MNLSVIIPGVSLAFATFCLIGLFYAQYIVRVNRENRLKIKVASLLRQYGFWE